MWLIDLSGIPEIPKIFKLGRVFERNNQREFDESIEFYLANDEVREKVKELRSKTVIDNNFLIKTILKK